MSNQFPSTSTVEISNVQLINIPSRCGVYLVEISHNGEATTRKRLGGKKVNGDCIVWSESLSFAGNLPERSLWYFRIVKPRLCFMTTILGSKSYELEKKLLDLLKSQKDHGSCELTIFKDCQLVFKIEIRGDALSGIINETKNTLAGTSKLEHLAKLADPVIEAADLVSQADPLMSFISHFETFMNIFDKISEIHPYVHAAWSILSVIPKTIIAQNERDKSINQLFLRLKEVYEYITDAKRLPTCQETQVKALSALVQQTLECAYFLKEYALLDRASKILKGVIINKKVDDFNEKFDHISGVMMNSTILETNIVTLRISNDLSELREKVEELKDLNLLEGMPRAQNSGFLSTKACLPGTRQGLITEILTWISASSDGSKRVFLLLGQAGMGKSAVAHTISQIFYNLNRLGSVFCFSQSYKENRNVLFSTISRELADGDVQWRKSLVRAIERTSIRISLDIITQFDELIVKPSKEVNTIGPVVIVIDGLDESGDRGERAVLLNLLFKRCLELPSNYRFVITSRPEPDIEPLSEYPTVFCKRMVNIDPAETTKDIQEYIFSRLSSVENILNKDLNIDWRLILAERAEGLFQWAKLACDIINPTVEFGVVGRAERCIFGPTSSLYQLYHQIFSSRSEFEQEGYLPAFKTTMGALIIIRRPLSIQALQSIFQNGFPHKIQSILAPFHSLFLGTHDLSTPVRPLHTSLMDFLTTRSIDVNDAKEKKNIPNQFYVDTSDQGYFTLSCLKLMNSGEGGLRFNICNLENSHILNRDVPDLDNRVQKKIPLHLSYASHFWAVHLQQSNTSEDLLIRLRLLMRTNLLYLFETLSLLEKSVDQVCISMKFLADWCKGIDDELASQAENACQFGYNFGDVMVESTPHLYISALPFAPNGSFIRDQYLNLFPRRFNIELGQSLEFPRSSNVIKQHPSHSSPTAIAFSPQGKYIATGFANGDFWLWDYKTGETVYQWRTDEREPKISTIVFSPNGESATACFLNGSFKILNIQKKELAPHSYGVFEDPCTYSTVSNDGHYLAFHSAHHQISLYNVASCSTIPLGFSGYSSIFSPNGEILASLVLPNSDHELCMAVSIWSIQKQKSIGWLYSEIPIDAMTFSPDGVLALHCIGTIQIWDALKATKVHEFSFGMSSPRSGPVTFSPNGNIAFLTYSGIQFMDISTGVLVQSLPCKNVFYATSLAVSSDCKHVAWVMADVVHVQECEITSKRADPVDRGLRYLKAIFSPLNTYLMLEGHDHNNNHYLQILNTATMIIIAQLQLKTHHYAISPNDKYIAYPAPHGLCLWSDGGRELVLDPSNRKFIALAFSFAGDSLISGDESGTIMVWNTHTCQLVCPPYTVMPSEIRILALAFSGTGTQFLVVYMSSSNDMIEIHSSQSGKLRGPFISPFSPHSQVDDYILARTVAFSANDTHIVYSHPWLRIIINARTGQMLKTFKPYSPGRLFYHLQHGISPNRKYVVMAWKGGVEVWDIDTGKKIDGKWQDCLAIQADFSNSSEEIATMDSTGGINFWDISSGNKSTMPAFYYYSHDGWEKYGGEMLMNDKYLVLARHSVEIWSLETHQIVSQHQSNSRELRTSSVDHSKFELSDGAIHAQSSSRPDGQERTGYALVAWKNALFSESSKMTENGWVLGPNGELLFWVPEERRKGLWRPKMAHLIGVPITKLNFDNFVHGSKWTECKEKL